ncbi:MAG: hypothetical protein K6T26_02755, partial [Alicyclobacillus sp.]|nr:hypothetical protein [Alicyclobacillus sp.]
HGVRNMSDTSFFSPQLHRFDRPAYISKGLDKIMHQLIFMILKIFLQSEQTFQVFCLHLILNKML